jgi:hypothetical protein
MRHVLSPLRGVNPSETEAREWNRAIRQLFADGEIPSGVDEHSRAGSRDNNRTQASVDFDSWPNYWGMGRHKRRLDMHSAGSVQRHKEQGPDQSGLAQVRVRSVRT